MSLVCLPDEILLLLLSGLPPLSPQLLQLLLGQLQGLGRRGEGLGGRLDRNRMLHIERDLGSQDTQLRVWVCAS